jgi:CheY-like chemotaxis protein/anti-sigma regulatory factor (Ser/Thr protein kinase)
VATGGATETEGAAAHRKNIILVVDDSPVDRRLAGAVIKSHAAWTTAYAANGREALEVICQSPPDLVLTDLLMPEMDGLALVEEIHLRYPNLPVILMTAHGSEEVALHALRAGAASYVPKKWLGRDLIPAIDQALAARKVSCRVGQVFEAHQNEVPSACAKVGLEDSAHPTCPNFLTDLESRYVLENDPAWVKMVIGHIQDDLGKLKLLERSRVRLTLALEEAMLNGIYHGNLEISSLFRQEGPGAFERLVLKRRQQSPYRERRLHVYTRLSPTEAIFVIRDEGPGFDYRVLPDPTDPANLENPNGRGLLLIRTFMDEVIHNDCGNQITMIKRNDKGRTRPHESIIGGR